MLRMTALAVALSFCVAGFSPAFAGDDREHDDITLSPGEFPAFRAAVDRELRSGRDLAELDSKDRMELAAVLERMGKVLAEVEDVEELDYRRRTDLFNDQEHLQVLLDQVRKDSRQVCERRRTVGSHVTRVVCMTAAERERRQVASQNTWRVVTNRGLSCQGEPVVGFDNNGDCRADPASDR